MDVLKSAIYSFWIAAIHAAMTVIWNLSMISKSPMSNSG